MPATNQNISSIEDILASLLSGSAGAVKIIPLDELFAREDVGEATAQNPEKDVALVEDLYPERVVGYAIAIVNLEHELDWSYLTEEARVDFLDQAQFILG